ncbi:hypothetical protein [Nostoc favosum]|uniref:Uncharacterized protein n=1 Tax=Nostoc favosum CHAB5714 TaxID=2780399 RepID=A0ABS8IBZ9_9NOSO|nr:hypothetical protein [Nostoc favosum]MCC5601689.1 hypothetical protein [Nostoc favosum CHAB5714]
MTVKTTESITRITRRLMLAVLTLVASGMMLLSSPAIAATITTLNPENFQTEVLQSDKPVVVVLVSRQILQNDIITLEQVSRKLKIFMVINTKLL